MSDTTLVAAFLGLVEGLTEFIPVSSTGHLLLSSYFLGFESPGRSFEVVIQLGAVLAILTVYSAKLLSVFRNIRSDPYARRFLLAVLIAFLPSMFAGAFAYKFIKTVLFESPVLISIMLIAGGVILLFVDRFAPEPRHHDAMRLPLRTAFVIGLFQCFALVPGTSRSGATIVGALLMGVGKRPAAEFSFFLSMPTMAGAFSYDLWVNRNVLDLNAIGDIVIGFAMAFISAIFVVRWLLNFVSRNGYAIFGWWRIIIGSLALGFLLSGF